jgi:hypothetical protein
LVRKEEKREGVIGEWKYNRNMYFKGEIWRREKRWNRVKEKSFVLACFRGWLTIDCCEQFRPKIQLHFYPNIWKPCCRNFFSYNFCWGFLYNGVTPQSVLGEHFCTKDLSIYDHLFISLVFKSVISNFKINYFSSLLLPVLNQDSTVQSVTI